MPTESSSSIRTFPTTRWSRVMRAGHGMPQIKREALNDLLKQYLPAIRSYLAHKRRIKPDQTDDLIQGFVASRVIERDLISRVQQERGKFRTFLLTALDRYITSEFRYRSAVRRSPGTVVQLDETPEPSDHRGGPVQHFEVEWARRVVFQTLRGMLRECRASGRNDLWAIFKYRLLGPIYGRSTPGYEEIVRRFGFRSPAQASNLLTTSKRKFTQVLRRVVSQYTDQEHVDQEIDDLMQILASSKGVVLDTGCAMKVRK